jgi:CHASE2 domain-containing sensor protein
LIVETRSTLAHRAILLALALLFTGLCYRFSARAREWGPELRAVNGWYRLRGPRPARNDFLIVAINNRRPEKKLLDAQGRVSRETLASLIRRAKAGGARAIVLDVYMPARTTHVVDRDLWLAIASRPQNVFLPAEYLPDRSNVLSRDDLRNLHFLEESVLTGEINAYGGAPGKFTWWKFQPPVSDFTHSAAGQAGGVGVAPMRADVDPDGVLRRVRLTYQTDLVYPPGTPASRLIVQGNINNVAVPNLALPVSTYVVRVDKHLLIVNYGKDVRFVGSLEPPIHLPIDRQGRMLINYVGPVGVYPTVNAADVLTDKVKQNAFNDKIVFIGVTEGNLADFYATPYSPQAPRVDVTANLVATVLDRAAVYQWIEGAWVPLGVLALFLALTLPFFTAMGATMWAILSAVLYTVITVFVFRNQYVLLPLVPAFLLILLLWLSSVALQLYLPPRRTTTTW